jgi:hypothetical protein
LECQWLLEVPTPSDTSPRLWLHKVKQKGQFKREQQQSGAGGIRLKDFMHGVLRQVGQRMATDKVSERVGQKLIGRGTMVLPLVVKEERPKMK